MKENKGFIITIVILVLISLGLGGFIFYDNFYLPSKVDDTLTEIDDQTVNLNSFHEIYDTLDKLDRAFNDSSSNYCGYPYSQKKLKIKKFKPDAAIFASLYGEIHHSGTLQYAFGGRVKNNFKEIFGKNIEYNPSIALTGGNNYQINYDDASGNFSYVAAPIQLLTSRYETYNVKTILSEDNIIVTRKVYYVDYASINGGNTVPIYTNNLKQSKIGDLKINNGYLNGEEVIAKHGSKCSTFNYIFRQEDDGTYSLIEIDAI